MVWLCVRHQEIAPVTACDSVYASDQAGLEGDHFNGKPGDQRMVTLIQAEHIELVAAIVGKSVDPALLRRNIVVSGINLLALESKKFQIGGALLEGTKPCPPCLRMEENLGHGGYNAMLGHGGINARVIRSGKISVGDPLTVKQDDSAGTEMDQVHQN